MSDLGFAIRKREGRNYPCLIGESCRELIDNYKMARVVWDQGNAEANEAPCRVTALRKKNG
jgi:hypothetical protein